MDFTRQALARFSGTPVTIQPERPMLYAANLARMPFVQSAARRGR